MILRALELQGFKSFPDKTVLEFGKGITSVIGPNGSGKSNISDAVRWVLGEQSTKSLRGSKMEDVIFSGTSVRKALGYAEVTLRLDNTDRSLHNCEEDEVSVTRRYYRSGEGEYLLNGEVCRLKDIHELFMDTGLGRDGYSIVGQGRVADLVSARSSQRRDMLEEAAGISHFRYRRSDANKKLDQAEENLVRLRDILSELESRVGPLKTQSEKAQKFLTLAAEKKELEIGLWVHTIEKSREGLKEQESKLSVAAAQYEQTEKQLNELAEKIEQAIADSNNLIVEIDEMRTKAAALEEEATVLDGQIAVENNTLEHNEQTIERITKDLSDAAQTHQDIDSHIETATTETEELNQKIAAKRNELEALLAEADAIRSRDSGFSEEAKAISEQISALTLQISDCRVEQSTAASAIDELKQRIENIDSVISSRSGILDELAEKRTQAQLALDKANAAVAEHGNSLDGYEMIVNSRAEKVEKIRKEIENLNLDIHQKYARIRMLDDLEKNLDGYAGSVKQIMKEVKRGTMRGIHGTVSQLITVEGDYSVAIETALGAAIQNIITDNENDAKRAITYLKDNRAGRATFLPMSAIKSKPFTEKGLEDCIGFVDTADKLVTCDKKYAEIIRSLLGRTVVVETIDDGIAMAKSYQYRFKIVTLDGQVLNAGGSMTGGSRGQNVGLLSRMNEIEELKATAKELENKLAERQATLKNVNAELALAQSELDGAEAELAKAQEDVIRSDGELKLVEDRFNSAQNALNELNDEKQRSNDKIAAFNKTSAESAAHEAQLAEQSNALGDKLAVLDDERGLLLQKREEFAEAQTNINLEIVALRKDVEAKLETIEELRRRREVHNGKVDELNEEIAAIATQSIAVKENIAQMTEKAQGLRKESDDSKAKVAQLIGKRTEVEASSTNLRTQERQVSADKEKISGELARLEERRDAMLNELDSAQNKLYDEYQLTLRQAQELGIVLEDIPKAQRTLVEIRGKIRALGNVNVGAVEEYKEVSTRYEFMKIQITDIEKSREELIKMIEELTGKMSERFREQFRRINQNFNDTFKELFDGGKAELVLEDPQDVLECNINIKVQPPGKNVQNIDLLSGGEKGLSAIALLFAILKVTPAPFCFFDEVEAALDDVNVTRYAKYVRTMTKNTQFILITHRRGTMEEADVLYGVTMQEEGVSKLLELKTAEMAKKLGLA